jgi:hypothetical protein
MEAICNSGTWVDFRRITLRYIPEDRTVLQRFVLNFLVSSLKVRDVYFFNKLRCSLSVSVEGFFMEQVSVKFRDVLTCYVS